MVAAPHTAFVLGGGGMLGAAEVGMLRALVERGVVPDLVVGCSVGAINGALIAQEPSAATVERLVATWAGLSEHGVFGGSLLGQLGTLVRHGTHLHDDTGLRALLDQRFAGVNLEDLAVRFECVAASIEAAGPHWFTTGPVTDAVVASCAVPGLLPPAEIGEEHFVDGGLVASVPVGRAVELGAQRIYVLQVGRLERPLRAPRRPWEVALVAFEIARRHHYTEALARVPAGVEVQVLPSGSDAPGVSVRYRNTSEVEKRIERAYAASSAHLDRVARAG